MERRSTDVQISSLIDKVEKLDKEVEKLRHDFDVHLNIEAEKYDDLKESLQDIQGKVNQLLQEIKEPLETYKTAKYGVSFIKFIADTAKWLVPLVVGSLIGYNVLGSYEAKPVTPQKQELKGIQ